MKAIKIDDTGSVLIQAGKLKVWVDVVEDSSGELVADWNKYIFYTDNEEDTEIKRFQEDCNNFIEATEEAISYYEMKNNINLRV